MQQGGDNDIFIPRGNRIGLIGSDEIIAGARAWKGDAGQSIRASAARDMKKIAARPGWRLAAILVILMIPLLCGSCRKGKVFPPLLIAV